MVEIENLSKGFENEMILKGVGTRIANGSICGLVGSNGAGKSTLLRCISGVYRPQEGEVRIGGESVYDAPGVKEKIFYLADESYFPVGADLKTMAKLYAHYYPAFDMAYFKELCKTFQLNAKKRLQSFSKGMRRQAALILAFSTRPQYLLLDESFDGLDPIVRRLARQLLCREVAERGMTVVISSHSLRELEDLCDQLLFLHQGKLLLDQKPEDARSSLVKVQVAFEREYDRTMFAGFDIVHYEQSGAVAGLILRGEAGQIRAQMEEKHPVLLELLPLSLEEVFICEAEELGYSFTLEEEGEEP
ncbi:MAG: ABC transporter ATP-binding protein [Lachnospiraceae bacterium]|nr:ABC transporter ATP-binding protein [Lachnospiraceae bacterium]